MGCGRISMHNGDVYEGAISKKGQLEWQGS